MFGRIRQLLDEQVSRLSSLERTVLVWLAVKREPVSFAELAATMRLGVSRAHLVEAVDALRRRSLVETGERGTLSLQPVVIEHTAAQTRPADVTGGAGQQCSTQDPDEGTCAAQPAAARHAATAGAIAHQLLALGGGGAAVVGRTGGAGHFTATARRVLRSTEQSGPRLSPYSRRIRTALPRTHARNRWQMSLG